MSIIHRILGLLTGHNGFNRKIHQEEVQRIRHENQVSWARVGDNLDAIKTEFQQAENGLKDGKIC